LYETDEDLLRLNLNDTDEVIRSASCRSIWVHASGDAVTDLPVDVTPVFECTGQHQRVHSIFEVTNDVRYETITRSIVQHVAHERACLAPIVVILAPRVSRVNEFAACLPLLNVGKYFIDCYARKEGKKIGRVSRAILDSF
jgi:hypothetical protein